MFGNGEKVEKFLAQCPAQTVLCHTLDAVALAKKCGKKPVASPSMNILNSLSMDKARDVMRARYGKDNATQRSENQLADLNAYLDSLVTPENFVSDEIEP